MDWLINLFTDTDSIAHIAMLYSLVIAVGVLLGKIKIGGISLGVTFVLFAGIFAGHFGMTAPKETLHFLQEFGLILFVFCIGLQVGPGFFESFRKGGVPMNLMAVLMVLLDVAVMFACFFIFFDDHSAANLAMMTGTLFGAVTNTPGLGAATEALHSFDSVADMPIASGYACAYPLGVLGIIGATIALRFICRVDLKEEEAKLHAAEGGDITVKPYKMHLQVENEQVRGKSLKDMRQVFGRAFVCTRILHNGHVSIPNGNSILELGDQIYVTCAEADVDTVISFIGPKIKVDWDKQDMPLTSKDVVITRSKINGKTLAQLRFSNIYGVNVTRIERQGMNLFARAGLPLLVGDRLSIVGREDSVERAASAVGNSTKTLNHPNIATIFLGIMVGVIFGMLPIAIPGMSVPLKLGIAGGPLVIAILIGRFGYKFKLITYTSTSANLMLREFGLCLFLASVGIKAGGTFVDTLVEGDGLKYLYTGVMITVIPILIVGVLARYKLKLNYYTLMGMIAGSHTDPPALAYANSVAPTDAPAVGYSTVYPLAMFMRILTAQLIIMLATPYFL